ncbi:MAG: hypothetical protein HC935_08655 [Pseudanabaena sp. SU_2_4]|nr:hypothetical protein [Pseudanabaena sp. SU_2_4]
MHKYDLLSSEALLNHILELVEQYRNKPNSQLALDSLRSARQQLAHRWLDTPGEMLESAYSGSLGKAHQTLLQSGLKEDVLTDGEKQFLDREVLPQMGDSIQKLYINHLLVAILYFYPHHVREDWEVNGVVPDWLLTDYLKFYSFFPLLFPNCW